MIKKPLTLAMMLMAAGLFAAPTISDVRVGGPGQYGFPWGKSCVNVRFTVSRLDAGKAFFLTAKARDMESGTEKPLPSLDMQLPSNGVYHVVWNAGNDLGTINVKRIKIALNLIGLQLEGHVRLWEKGPCWAVKNIGAENPWDAGYYFWWGDTLGYKREGNQWVASDGSVRGFGFFSGNTPTYGKDNATLQREGWITAAGNLAPAHDAASVHWGNGWRMPTADEIQALVDNTTTEWTTVNGVPGRLVKGKGAYSSASIFLPAAGYGIVGDLYYSGSSGHGWSSSPYSGYSGSAWGLDFDSGNFGRYSSYRPNGLPVRPLLGFAE